MNEIHLTIETVATIVGIIFIVAPAAYAVGRFNQRLTTVELQIKQFMEAWIEVASKVATTLENVEIDIRDGSKSTTHQEKHRG